MVLAGPDGVASVRRQARDALAGWGCDADVVDDAVLVLSELAGNALLHAGDACRVAIAQSGDHVRIEVEDASPVVPAPNAYGPEAHTGRGLALVAALSSAWGVSLHDGGKMVWSEIPLDGQEAEPSTGAELSGEAPVSPTEPGGVVVRFTSVPVADYLALQEQNDAVQRDVDLLLIGAGEGLPAPVPDALLAACHRLRDRFGVPVSSYRETVVEAARRGLRTVDLERWFPAGSGPAGAEYVALVEEIEGYARQGYLFVDPPRSEVVALRRWFVSEVRRQCAGERPRPAPTGDRKADASSDRP
jgi:anti-sigma regulatory factor (Ser/Thr protein kinase)